MEAGNKLLELLKDLAEQLPSLLTILACMVFAIARWQRTRKVSQVVLTGLVLLFLHLIVFSIVYNWVPDLFIGSASYPSQASTIRIMYLILGLITNSSLGVALAVLLTAIFIQRPSTNHQ
jgi:heme/copper-type cytochrome/quinol oxidase subunit 4